MEKKRYRIALQGSLVWIEVWDWEYGGFLGLQKRWKWYVADEHGIALLKAMSHGAIIWQTTRTVKIYHSVDEAEKQIKEWNTETIYYDIN